MKKPVVITIIGLIFGAGAGVAVLTSRNPGPKEIKVPGITRQLARVSTTTEMIAPFFLYVYDPGKEQTGACFVLKNASGNGFTYLTAENGALKTSATGCTE